MKKCFLILSLLGLNSKLMFPQYLQPVLEGTHQNAFTKVGAPSIYSERVALNKTATSNFQVVYNFPTPPFEARYAIEEAAKIWGYLFNTDFFQPITILVTWENLGYNSSGNYPLAHCNSTSYYNSPSLPQNAQYPIALAEFLLHENLNGDSSEMRISVNSNDSVSWYYGLDGMPQAGKVDMITTILHEIAHGLGFHTTFNVSSNLGYYGVSNFPIDTNSHPARYDQFIVNSSFHLSTDLLLNDPNPSTQLMNRLISNNVFFNGDNAWIQNGSSANVKLYAPSNWRSGVSISHLDDDTYPTGTSNSLMTHATNQAEVIHSPGEVGLAILQDMGWTINRLATFTHPEPGMALQKGAIDTIRWKDTNGGTYRLDLVDTLGFPVTPICYSGLADQGFNEYVWTVPSNIPNGKYRIKESWDNCGITGTFIITDQQQVAPPELSYHTGTYSEPINVTASCETPGAEIRYTINNINNPDINSPIFPSVLPCSTLTTIRVKGFKNGMLSSNTTVETYNIGFSEPTVSLPSGDYPLWTTLYISWPYGYDCYFQKSYNNTMPSTPQSQNCCQLWTNPGYQFLGNGVDSIERYKFQLKKGNEWGPVVYVIYNIKPPLRIAQIDDEIPGDNPFGYWNKWENNQWLEYPDTILIRPSSSTNFVIKASQDFKPQTNRKYKVWSTNLAQNFYPNPSSVPIGPNTQGVFGHFKNASTTTARLSLEGSTSLNGGFVYFKDPWLTASIDSQHANSVMNRGVNALFKQRQSPFYADYNTNYNGDVYKGVFLNQGADWQPPYYSVKAISPQPVTLYNTGVSSGRSHSFYFQKWSRDFIGGQPSAEFQDSMALQTGIVFKQQNAVVKANMKGTQLSGDQNAYGNNSQRKFVRTNNGYLHNVYESMDRVWYERSTNNGATWEIMNDGKPLSNQDSRSPAITIADNKVLIVYQERIGVYAKIILFRIDGSYQIGPEEISNGFNEEPYEEDLMPVISFNDDCYIPTYTPRVVLLIIWRAPNTGSFNYVYGRVNFWTSEFERGSLNSLIHDQSGQYLDNNSTNLAVSFSQSTDYQYTYRFFTLVWEQKINSEASRINLCYLMEKYLLGMNPQWRLDRYNDFSLFSVSNGSAYTKNSKPSLVSFVTATNQPTSRICWIGERNNEIPLPTENVEKTVVFAASDYLGHFWTFGNGVTSTSINKTNDKYAIAWASGDNNVLAFADNTTLRPVGTINIRGKDVQLSNGTTSNTMYALAFNTSSLPYYMQTAVVNFNQQPIAEEVEEEREGIASDGEAQIYFNIGDIAVDNQQVSFIDMPDTVNITSQQSANQYLVSEPFSLNNSSEFFYSVRYGITDSLAALGMLSGNTNITFRVELLDAATNELLGVFDEVTYDQFNIMPYENIDYRVNTYGIGERMVKLRLVINSSNLNPDYSVAERYDSEAEGLAKKNYKQVNYQGSLVVKEYALDQNYPNPFNPTTTINYQIKEDGLVTLKIYDALGSEVKTLVNEEKTQGRYSYNFNALDLASGVYIYQLRVNDYVSSKKLMLLK